MLIGELGEFGLIKRIKKRLKTDSSVVKGIGDDCAVLEFNKNKYLLSTCDMIVEGVDFTAKDNPYLVGRKALAVSLSDIAACGGIPGYALVSLGLPKGATVALVDKILGGIIDLARDYKVNIVGGDLSRARRITLDVSILGFVEKRRLVLRSGARPGDIIFVSGSLGGSISGRHLRFSPRIKEARFLSENFKPSSMIDISDGLAQDLSHILEESRAGAIIYEGLLPLSKDARGLKDALYMGEDFELLFTLRPKEAKKLLKAGRGIFHPIGEIRDKKCGLKLIGRSGKEKGISARGFRHF